jgi:hypothetical protein
MKSATVVVERCLVRTEKMTSHWGRKVLEVLSAAVEVVVTVMVATAEAWFTCYYLG